MAKRVPAATAVALGRPSLFVTIERTLIIVITESHCGAS
jgi:hypothetical protein